MSPSIALPVPIVTHQSTSGSAQDSVRILGAAWTILSQGAALLSSLHPEDYARKVPQVFNASIGGHYRHCLDHFSSVIRGLDTNRVDYDHRERDSRIENDPGYALMVTQQILEMLATLPPDSLSTPVVTLCEVSYEHGNAPVTHSTLGREIVYSIAHAIHHYALISVMARLMNAQLPETFGVAPSTVAHQKSVGQQ